MAVNIANIPPNAVGMLFVEDLMKWLLERQDCIPYETGKAERYRKFILNVFNEDVRRGVNFIETSMEIETDEHFSAFEELNEKSFLDYALYCEEIHLKEEFQADCFLKYCVRLGSMAARFTRCNVPQTIHITLDIILKLLEDRGMFKGGWDALIEVGRKYAKISDYCFNIDTPDTSDEEIAARNSDETLAVSSKNEPPTHSSEDESPVYSSDDELQTNSSSDSLDMNEETQICHFVSSRGKLQKPGRKVFQPDRSSKAATSADFNSGQSLEVTSSIYKLPNTSEKYNASSMSKLIDTNGNIQREIVE